MRWETEEGLRMRRERREGGEKGTEVIDGNIIEPSRGRECVEKVCSVKGPKLAVILKGELRGWGMRMEKGTQPRLIWVLRGDAKTRGSECRGGNCAEEMKRGRGSNLLRRGIGRWSVRARWLGGRRHSMNARKELRDGGLRCRGRGARGARGNMARARAKDFCVMYAPRGDGFGGSRGVTARRASSRVRKPWAPIEGAPRALDSKASHVAFVDDGNRGASKNFPKPSKRSEESRVMLEWKRT
jgi:hypothetical protein